MEFDNSPSKYTQASDDQLYLDIDIQKILDLEDEFESK